MSTLKVNTISASTSGQGVSIDIQNPKTNRNLIINGAMQIAQRGTSSTSNGIHTIDMYNNFYNGTDESPTQAQVDVASGTTPYSLGFRKALKITNGNQTSVGSNDYIAIQHGIEAQNIAQSGWNYTSSSSFVTLSFWIKSSVAQTFKGYLRTSDGTKQHYPFETGSLTADTWTKITKTVPGNSNIQIDNDNGNGFQVLVAAFWGTDGTASSVTENAWAAFSESTRMTDNTSTWYSTNDATLEITGLQLEVGSVPTDFEFKSRSQELALCQRYYFSIKGDDDEHVAFGYAAGGGFCVFMIPYPVPMRAQPTYTGSATVARFYNNAQSANFNLSSLSFGNADTNSVEPKHGVVFTTTTSGMSTGAGGSLALNADNGILEFSADL
tara:strand:+ start:249 stop:1394 length:1146 start_codon:yes stop_codon:yes gene_type:complete